MEKSGERAGQSVAVGGLLGSGSLGICRLRLFDVLVPAVGVLDREEGEAKGLEAPSDVAFHVVAVGTGSVLGVVILLVRLLN